MKPLIQIAEWIDKINEKLGYVAAVAVLLSCLISSLNAFIRYGFDYSSNGFLEIQWYMFAYVVMFGTAYVFKMNEHVRVDVLYGRLSTRKQVWVDMFGITVFMLPVCAMMIYLSAPLFLKMFNSGEMSSNAGGLIRWPAMMALPLGFSLLALQGLSELIKRLGYVTGQYNMSINYEKPLQ